jgi:hypothetical protein
MEDLGALAEQRGDVGHARDQRPDRLLVEPSGKIATGHGFAIRVPLLTHIITCLRKSGTHSRRGSRIVRTNARNTSSGGQAAPVEAVVTTESVAAPRARRKMIFSGGVPDASGVPAA